jgi:hypothetical protein
VKQKTLVLGVVVVFLVFWMVQDSASLARVTREGAAAAWDVTQQVFTALIDFLGSVVD